MTRSSAGTRGDGTALPQSTYALLCDAAETHPNRPAITYLEIADLDLPDAEPQQLTQRQFLESLNRAANTFLALGAKPNSVISILAPSVPEAMIALWAAEAVGIANPINFLLRPDDIAGVMRAVGAEILVSFGPHPQVDIWSKIPAIRDAVPSLKAVLTIGPDDPAGTPALRTLMRDQESTAVLSGRRIGPDEIAAYFHTAGTTSAPKIAAQTHGNQVFAARALAQAWNLNPRTRMVNALPFFHVAGSILLGLAPLGAGSEILLPTAAGLRNPEVVARHWEMVDRFRPTIIGGIPTSLVSLIEVPLRGADIECVRFCATGGAPLPKSLGEAFTRHFNMPVLQIYGMTECSGLIAVAPEGEPTDYAEVGRVVPGMEVQARRLQPDGRPGATLPPGESGVLVVRGPQVFPGYLDPAQTAAAFTEDGWLITGDVGSVDGQGRLRLTGRAKDIIIRGGHNIDPAVIEEAANRHPAVATSAAVGMPDAYAGEVPILYVAPRPGSRLSLDALMAYLRTTLAEDRARPAEVVAVDALPLTSMGKISKVALRRDATRRAAERTVAAALGDAGTARVTVEDDSAGVPYVVVTLEAPGSTVAEVEAALGRLGVGYRVNPDAETSA